jgi:hypothetical protein
MSAEGFIVSNPRNNNVDVEISFVGRDGSVKKFKTLRPGEGCLVDKKVVTIAERRRPPRLLANSDGTCVPDTGH